MDLNQLRMETGHASPEDPRPAAGGHGIVGMRERAAILGGSVDAASAHGGFTVRARLPYAGASDER